jgi:hypothetical protein
MYGICKEKKIIATSMPSHSSHILQPLDVGCFGPLKRAYSQQIEQLVKSHINHVTEVDFLIAFKAAFFTTMRETSMKAEFRALELVPLDLDIVLSKLNIKLRTPSPPGSPATTMGPLISQTLHSPTEAGSQSTLIKDRIDRHHSSSQTPIYEAVDQLAKGTQALAHSVTLLNDQVRSLQRANEALSKRRNAKRTRIQHGRMLSVQTGLRIISQKGTKKEIEKKKRKNGSWSGMCGKAGHNSRTCDDEKEVSYINI